MLPSDFHWGISAALWLYAALPLLVLLWLVREQLTDYHLSRYLSVEAKERLGVHRGGRWVVFLLLALAWCCAVLALASPQGEGRSERGDQENIEDELVASGEEEAHKVLRRRKVHEVVFLLDVSASMEVADTRTGQTRLAFAKDVIDEVARQLSGERVALYAFTSELTPVVPLTNDIFFLRMMVKHTGINEGDVAGTDLFEALGSWRRHHYVRAGQTYQTLIVLTDGGDTQIEALKGAPRDDAIDALGNFVHDLENTEVYFVGVGTKGGEVIPGVTFDGSPVRSSLDEALLRSIAETGQGKFFYGEDYSSLAIADQLVERLREMPKKETAEEAELEHAVVDRTTDQNIQYTHYFQYPLALAIVALGTEILVRKRRLQKKSCGK